MSTATMLLSGLDLAISAVGFAVLYEKLNVLEGRLRALISKVDGIAELLQLDERAQAQGNSQKRVCARATKPGERA